MNVVVIGAGGLLGSACLRIFNESPSINAVGTFRTKYVCNQFPYDAEQHYFLSDALDTAQLEVLFQQLRPTVVVNCTSLSKDSLQLSDPLELIPIYALLPHVLAKFCSRFSARLIQISSDGVFSGDKGNYREEDIPDASDLYGRTKLMGEVVAQGCVTLRTSMIGHDPKLQNGLVSWFLNQKGTCKGFSNAIFSGFPVTVLARIIRDYVVPHPKLEGIYNLASSPISKFDLLRLISEIYDTSVTVIPDNSIKINRSLNASSFNTATQYVAPSWGELITVMRDDYSRYK
jgi:dTDP-4-dehydrorhamnose reductase